MEKLSGSEQGYFKIECKEDKPKRITIESRISLDNEALKKIQQSLIQKLEGFSADSLDELHLTLGHFGKPDELYKELSVFHPPLDAKDFDREFQQLLLETEKVMSQAVNVHATEIRVFESGAVVLILDKEILMEAKRMVYDATIKFLTNLHIPEPESYIRGSAMNSNLHYLLPERWTPHITIGWIKSDVEETPIAEKSVETIDLEINLQPSYVSNAKRNA